MFKFMFANWLNIVFGYIGIILYSTKVIYFNKHYKDKDYLHRYLDFIITGNVMRTFLNFVVFAVLYTIFLHYDAISIWHGLSIGFISTALTDIYYKE